MLQEHGEPIEADLQRYYGIPLADLFAGRLSWRRLKVLIRQLPRESATARSQIGPVAEWTVGEYLLAALLDTARHGNWQRGGGKGQRPRPVPRPTERPIQMGRTNRSSAEVKNYLARFRPQRDEAVTNGR